MSWHYYCWALGYAHEGEFDPVLRVVCDDVRIEKKYWLWSHDLYIGSQSPGVQHSPGTGRGAGGQRSDAD